MSNNLNMRFTNGLSPSYRTRRHRRKQRNLRLTVLAAAFLAIGYVVVCVVFNQELLHILSVIDTLTQENFGFSLIGSELDVDGLPSVT
jgi:hypothetical protein